MKVFVSVALLCLGGALASPAPYADNSLVSEVGLQAREAQLLSIAEGARQLQLLFSEVYGRGSETARALSTSITPSSVARALRENDPVELALNPIERMIIWTGISGYRFGGMAYELIKSGVPALERYGYVSTRDLGVDSCRQAFPCQFSASPLMERARQVRSVATDFCDLEGDSYTSSACRLIASAVDTLETL
ncbi:hypothetical protein FJT64_012036 [Amphibalanus amphitrite]|uniref:Uncharacterized protein n=1 Tax=Amphibalanus amphitrite TaxID=1232801 RepID=A0A6A4VDV9_AMPAM|nr:hypothetical protein FJT64_012036 [Amphibalanus amphitrite]